MSFLETLAGNFPPKDKVRGKCEENSVQHCRELGIGCTDSHLGEENIVIGGDYVHLYSSDNGTAVDTRYNIEM